MSVMEIICVTITALMWRDLIYAHVIPAMSYNLMAGLVKVSMSSYIANNLLHIFVPVDVNECLDDNGGCPQTCDNTDGSYQCSCQHGYEWDNDNHTCIGM